MYNKLIVEDKNDQFQWFWVLQPVPSCQNMNFGTKVFIMCALSWARSNWKSLLRKAAGIISNSGYLQTKHSNCKMIFWIHFQISQNCPKSKIYYCAPHETTYASLLYKFVFVMWHFEINYVCDHRRKTDPNKSTDEIQIQSLCWK